MLKTAPVGCFLSHSATSEHARWRRRPLQPDGLSDRYIILPGGWGVNLTLPVARPLRPLRSHQDAWT